MNDYSELRDLCARRTEQVICVMSQSFDRVVEKYAVIDDPEVNAEVDPVTNSVDLDFLNYIATLQHLNS